MPRVFCCTCQKLTLCFGIGENVSAALIGNFPTTNASVPIPRHEEIGRGTPREAARSVAAGLRNLTIVVGNRLIHSAASRCYTKARHCNSHCFFEIESGNSKEAKETLGMELGETSKVKNDFIVARTQRRLATAVFFV